MVPLFTLHLCQAIRTSRCLSSALAAASIWLSFEA